MNVDRWLNLFAVQLLIVLVVVLIFYMVVTPLLPHIPLFLEVPISSAGVKSPEVEGDIMVAVLRDGRTTIAGEAVTDLRFESGRVVRLRVDRAAPFGSVRGVVRAAQEVGYRQVTFMVEEREAAPAPSYPVDAGTFAFDCPPDYRAAATALFIAIVSFAAAVAWRFLRRGTSAKPGRFGWLLLASTIFWLSAAWSAYRPSCFWY